MDLPEGLSEQVLKFCHGRCECTNHLCPHNRPFVARRIRCDARLIDGEWGVHLINSKLPPSRQNCEGFCQTCLEFVQAQAGK